MSGGIHGGSKRKEDSRVKKTFQVEMQEHAGFQKAEGMIGALCASIVSNPSLFPASFNVVYSLVFSPIPMDFPRSRTFVV